ncbi:DUF222 domain-containing protein [Paeniglutamicibacter sp. R2-26]|uniref:HNH endonuclease n=1 Tax=Paeniglutamicibacter sp. R2-26 TaxID=3144417 RepID=UPI003EE4C5A0
MDFGSVEQMGKAILDLNLDLDAHGLIEVFHALEALKSTIASVEAMAATLFEAQVISRHRELDKYRSTPNYGAGSQLALARHESPDAGNRYLKFSKQLILELPYTLGALAEGRISEQQAMVIATETADLTSEDRHLVDEELLKDPRRIDGMGTKELANLAKKLAYTFDSRDTVTTLAEAKRKRHFSVFNSREGTMTIHGSLPVEQGLALKQALEAAAQQLKSSGDERTLDQLRCDLAVERITGGPEKCSTKVLVNLVMTDRTLFQGESEPAYLDGYGTVPASWARALIAGGNQRDCFLSKAAFSLVRLYTAPGTGQLVGMDSRQRQFPIALRHFITIRDQICRTPYCNAPIKHMDHVLQHALGGPTSEFNGNGRCRRCNLTKELDGWKERVVPGLRHTIEVETPYGFTYSSMAPPLPGTSLGETSNSS